MLRTLVVSLGAFTVGCFGSHAEGPDAGHAGPPHDAALDAVVAADDWVEETLGWRVRFRCSDTRCNPPLEDAPADFPVRCPEDHPIPYVVTSIDGRVTTLFATCADSDGWRGWHEGERPIVCASDSQCARLQNVDGVPRCVDGICQLPEVPLRWHDVVALCTRAIPRPEEAFAYTYPLSPELTRAYELVDETCPYGGEICTVPPECAPAVDMR